MFVVVFSDVFEEFFSPTLAAQGLLHSAVSKRKQVLQKTMQFVVGVMATPNVGPRQKDGALHMIGSIADVILKVNLPSLQHFNPCANFAW